MKEKGYMLTWDVLVALFFLFMILAGYLSVQYFRSASIGRSAFEEAHFSAEDALEVLNKKGVLEQMGREWSHGNYSNTTMLESENFTGASNISKYYLDQIIADQIGYRILIDNTTIYDSGYSPGLRAKEYSASDKTRAVRLVSGYKEDKPKAGWAAMAWLMENVSGTIDELYYNWNDLIGNKTPIVQYSGFDERKVLYLRVPRPATVTGARVDISWSGVGIGTTTTTMATTTTLFTSCKPCPGGACPIPAANNRTEAAPLYNYHTFTLLGTCDVTITLTPDSVSNYELYTRWAPGACPSDINFDCTGPLIGDGPGVTEVCTQNNLPPGDYYVRVDCYIYYGVPQCTGTYDLDISITGCS